MMHGDAAGDTGGINHPRAKWMAVIAFINQNLAIAGVFGSFSVLLISVQARLHVDAKEAGLAVSALTLAGAICGPLVGWLATRYSLRLVMLAGSILGVIGFLLLANTASYPLYILAYGLFFGPSMSAGTVLPSALVTRWFTVNRGKTLGLICAPIVIPIIPLAANWTIHAYGAVTTYYLLAGLGAISVVANLFITDHPPGAVDAPVEHVAPKAAGGSVTVAQLLREPRFWARTLAFSISSAFTIMLSMLMVPMGKSWLLTDTQSAIVLSLQCFAGIVGAIAMGWVADRIGGLRTLILLTVNDAILFVLLAWHPGFVAIAIFAFLFGTQSAANVPIYGLTLSESFGRENFARAFGLAYLINLPFTVLAVPFGPFVYERTGSYSGALLAGAVLFALVAFFIFVTRREKPRAA